MLDLGWPELMVIAAVTVIVVGPRELPRVLRTVNGYVRKARSLASEFHSSIEDMARDADLEDMKKQIKGTADEFGGDFEKDVDPTGDVSKSMKDFRDSMNANAEPFSGNSLTRSMEAERKKAEETAKQEAGGGGKPAAKKAGDGKTGGGKTGGKKAAAKKAGGKKAAAKKTAAKRSAAKKTGAKKTAAKKAPAKTAGPSGGGADRS